MYQFHIIGQVTERCFTCVRVIINLIRNVHVQLFNVSLLFSNKELNGKIHNRCLSHESKNERFSPSQHAVHILTL